MSQTTFADLLSYYIARSGLSYSRLAARSGVPGMTINDWANGRSRRPFWWERLVRVAAALDLDARETSNLLEAAGHPALEDLFNTARAQEERALLARWQTNEAPFQPPAREVWPVGRDPAINMCRNALLEGSRTCVLVGMAGVGKTTLAIHLAHELRPFFSDGVLWADLTAFIAGDEASPGAIDEVAMPLLASFAHEYGIGVREENTLASRQALVRSLLADKQVLVVIDNVFSDAMLAAVLPPLTRGSLLITSRLKTLGSGRGWSRVPLSPLDRDAGRALLGGLAGPERVEKEAQEAGAIVDLLGGLPLALNLAGRVLEERATTRLAIYRTQLETEERRLDELGGAPRLRASFEQGYRLLSPATRDVFAAFSVFAGPSVSLRTVADALDLDPTVAEAHLARLVSLSLLERRRPGRAAEDSDRSGTERYQMHALLRLFAATKTGPDRDLIRARAIESLIRVIPAFTLDVSRFNEDFEVLRSLLSWASTAGRTDLVRHAAHALSEVRLGQFGYLDAAGAWREGAELMTESLAGVPAETHEAARLRIALGAFQLRLGRMDEAHAALSSGLTRLTGEDEREEDRLLVAYANAFLAIHASNVEAVRQRNYLQRAIATLEGAPSTLRGELGHLFVLQGAMLGQAGELARARESAQRGLELLPASPSSARVTAQLAIGASSLVLGDRQTARDHFTAGLADAEALGDQRGRGNLWQNLAVERHWAGYPVEALGFATRALTVFEAIGGRAQIGLNLAVMARIYLDLGDPAAAHECIRDALDLARAEPFHRVELYARLALAQLYLTRREPTQALDEVARVQALFERVGETYLRSDANRVTALAFLRLGNLTRATHAILRAFDGSQSRRDLGISHRVHGEILAAGQRREEAHQAFAAALRTLEGESALEAARSMKVFGAWLAEEDDGEGRVLIERADQQLATLCRHRHVGRRSRNAPT